MFKKYFVIVLAGCMIFSAMAQNEIALSGTVKDATGAAVAGALVSLVKDYSVKDITDDKGEFVLTSQVSIQQSAPYAISIQNVPSIGIKGNHVQFTIASETEGGTISIYSGNGKRCAVLQLGKMEAGTHLQLLPELSPGFYLMHITIDQLTTTSKLVNTGSRMYLSGDFSSDGNTTREQRVATASASIDTLMITKEGFKTVKKAIDSYKATGIAIVVEKDGGGGEPVVCEMPTLPDPSGLTKVNEKLPDPFTFYDGTKLTKKAQWACRRKEILAMAEKYLYGPMPAEPDEITGKVNSGSIDATVKVGSKTKNMSFKTSGSGDILCLVVSAGINPSGCRTYNLSSGDKNAVQELYGMSATGTIAAAWTANVICKAVASDPSGGIDTNKIMVTGCSGAGKVAFSTGAFVEGIDLTVIVESGGGGAASLRMAEWYRHGGAPYQCADAKPQGIDNLEDNGLAGPWVSQSAAGWVRSSPAKVKNLPFDQHCVLACIAPRACCHVTNQHGSNEWCHLGGTCEALSAYAAKPVWNALGVPDNFGFLVYTEGSAPMHCGNPASATGLAGEFFKRVFQGDKSAKTDVFTAKDQDLQSPVSEWKSKWIDWDMETTLE